jgi:hypothetical protein
MWTRGVDLPVFQSAPTLTSSRAETTLYANPRRAKLYPSPTDILFISAFQLVTSNALACEPENDTMLRDSVRYRKLRYDARSLSSMSRLLRGWSFFVNLLAISRLEKSIFWSCSPEVA